VRGPAKHLTKGVAIYGAGDAITTVVNFLLLPVYVKFNILTPTDYGALALIMSVETFAKVLSRLGLDGRRPPAPADDEHHRLVHGRD
jgi:O-antigen/teichoic acid export membrane protein